MKQLFVYMPALALNPSTAFVDFLGLDGQDLETQATLHP
jgi:hypothetical protein